MAFRLGRGPKEPSVTTHDLNEAVARDLQAAAKKSFSGAVEFSDKATGASGSIFLLDGGVYATALTGYVPPIAARLWSSGAMDRDRSERLLEELNGNALDPRAGAVAVDNGWVKVETLGTMHQEFLLASVGAMLALPKAKVKTTSGRTTSHFCTLPLPVDAVLDAVRMRTERMEQTWASADPPCEPEYAVLVRDGEDLPSSITIREARALAEAANGSRTLDEIAWRLGLTRAEAVHITVVLARAGVLTLTGPAAPITKQSLWVPEEFGRELAAPPESTPAPSPVATAAVAAVVIEEVAPETEPEPEADTEPWPESDVESTAPVSPMESATEPEPVPEPEPEPIAPTVSAPEPHRPAVAAVAVSAASVAVKERTLEPDEPIDEHVRQLRAEVARQEVAELQSALQLAVQEEMDAIAKAAAIRARLRSAEETVAELTAGDVDG